ncbi:hypothetical protein IWQ62_000951 [Dispira parvispora]|uniref:Leucine-rich repeat domain-containing protein n=1 Tax=Dispira parvispora TaxID=1520584 RepID=A0A9W8ATP3_9FUNG|nr:hypothetical protein IWQ62_000951 [Dispira parvispora]
MKLTPAILSEWSSAPISEVKTLELARRDISCVDDLSFCIELRKLDLSHNALSEKSTTAGLVELKSLTWLNISNNHLDHGSFISAMDELIVLNFSHNELIRIPEEIVNCPKLKALVLGNNQIQQVENLGKLEQLNTLVLSNNRLTEIPLLLKNTEIVKLSLGNNQIRVIPDLSHLSQLRELRLNNNKILTIPNHLSHCASLEILDLGNNILTSWSDVESLAFIKKLTNLNLKGNKVCDEPDYRNRVLKLIPTLRVLDGQRCDEKYRLKLEKRQNRQVHRKSEKPRAPLTPAEDHGKPRGVRFSKNRTWIRPRDKPETTEGSGNI